jgi:hypothetical protein
MNKKNPLYFVKGKDVEAVNNMFELILKRLGLTSVLEFIKTLINQVKSYPMLEIVNKLIGELIEKVLLSLRTFGFQV